MTHQPADAVAQWNSRYPIGTPVTAYPGLRPEDDPAADRLITRTRSEAQALGGHTAVVWVDGHDACVALSHVDPVQPADTYTPPAKYQRSDGATCCPHATPVAPGSCEACWDLVKWNAVDARLIPSSPAAVSAAVAPPTLAVAEAALAIAEAALCDTLLPDAREEALAGIAAVQTTDRAAVLADVERAIRTATGSCGYKAEDGCDFCGGVDAALDQVRRMADETATETPAAEPTAEDIARAHVTSLHLIGEQLATIESWFWEHLADVRDAGARQDQTATETPHTCDNCDGIDPDTCFNNPNRPPEQCPAAEFEDYGQQCQKPAGHNLHSFEEQPAAGARQDGAET
ncbi:hypothetical protein OH715_16980 [Streptomyces cellulosae]|nr:hypothetical protein OH715_16980 [Streptomyces cellulosae]